MGVGGGIFLVPSLTLLFHLPIQVAVGTSLIGVIATSAGVAAARARGRGADITLALRLEVVTAGAAIIGGLVAGVVSHQALSILFAVIVFLTAGYTTHKGRQRPSDERLGNLSDGDYQPRHWIMGLSVSSLAGLVSGLLGVGGGFIKVPIMYAVMEVPLGIATRTSNFMVGITAAASVFVYYGRGEIRPLLVVPTVLGVYGGAVIGTYLAPRVRVPWLRQALVVLLIVIGIQMFVHGAGF